jgi:putative endonuclease
MTTREMTKHNQRLGKFGEQAAAAYLKSKGYAIVDVNARTPHGEIDVVAALGDVTVFVEVKTRSSRQFGAPEEAITPRKLSHMLNAASFYAAEHAIDHWQIDVIAIEKIPGKVSEIVHFENVA